MSMEITAMQQPIGVLTLRFYCLVSQEQIAELAERHSP